jgi:membrane protein
LALVFGSTIAFAEIHAGLNRIWRVGGREGWFSLVRGRFVAFLMVIGLGLLLLASAVTSTVLDMASSVVEDLTGGSAVLVSWGETAASFLLVAVAFAAVFKFVPDATVRWRDVWLGALITAGLFNVGRFLIGTYLATRAFQSVYGAAGAFVAFLFWTYYSAQVFFFGAEWTHTYAHRDRRKRSRSG